jgi:hypothetical protein
MIASKTPEKISKPIKKTINNTPTKSEQDLLEVELAELERPDSNEKALALFSLVMPKQILHKEIKASSRKE